jgi:hypothetical protein
MDESKLGKVERGQWAPDKPISYGPAFAWPWSPGAFLKWFFGYPGFLFPWTVAYGLLALVLWQWFTPSLETMKTLNWDWVLFILARNMAMMIIVSGGLHLWLYRWKKQGTNFKYNKQWPKEESAQFAFGSQIYDNMFYSLVSGLRSVVAVVLCQWLCADDYICRTPHLVLRTVPDCTFHSRCWLLLRAPPRTFSSAVQMGASCAPP